MIGKLFVGVAGALLLLSVRDARASRDIDDDDWRPDVLHCEEAVTKLVACCPRFAASAMTCTYEKIEDIAGCDFKTTTTVMPALDELESGCVLLAELHCGSSTPASAPGPWRRTRTSPSRVMRSTRPEGAYEPRPIRRFAREDPPPGRAPRPRPRVARAHRRRRRAPNGRRRVGAPPRRRSFSSARPVAASRGVALGSTVEGPSGGFGLGVGVMRRPWGGLDLAIRRWLRRPRDTARRRHPPPRLRPLGGAARVAISPGRRRGYRLGVDRACEWLDDRGSRTYYVGGNATFGVDLVSIGSFTLYVAARGDLNAYLPSLAATAAFASRSEAHDPDTAGTLAGWNSPPRSKMPSHA